MRARLPTFSSAQHQWVRQWRAALARSDEPVSKRPAELRALNLGDRARLRRASSRFVLAGDPAALVLARGLVQRARNGMPADREEDYHRVGLLAGVIALVDDDLGDSTKGDGAAGRTEMRTLARRLGRSDKGEPVMSGLRFRRLLATADPEDLLRQWRRAVQLAKRRAHVASLADDLYTWLMELERPERYADRSVRFHWAYDYYQQPLDEAPSGEPTPAPEAAG